MYVHIAKKLLNALETEEWNFCNMPLRQVIEEKEHFCGLGILCELHRRETGGEWYDEGQKIYSYLGTQYVLPRTVMEWACIHDNVGKDSLNGHEYCIVTLCRETKNFEKLKEFLRMALNKSEESAHEAIEH